MSDLLSLDLAYKRAEDVGCCLISVSDYKKPSAQFISPHDIGIHNPPDPNIWAATLREFLDQTDITLLLIDGPQAWKSANNGVEHSRICERQLNTPGKTGLPGHAKPENYLGFIAFSIELFTELIVLGGRLVTRENMQCHSNELILVETFPMAAWKHLGRESLPAKTRCKKDIVQSKLEDLAEIVDASCEPCSHDQLQSLVAGFAGVGILKGDQQSYALFGAPPIIEDGIWREGFIANPQISNLHARNQV